MWRGALSDSRRGRAPRAGDRGLALLGATVLIASWAMCRRPASTKSELPIRRTSQDQKSTEVVAPGWTDSRMRISVVTFTVITIAALSGILGVSNGAIAALSELRPSSPVRDGLLRGLALNVLTSLSLGVAHSFTTTVSRWTTPGSFLRPTQALILAGLVTIREAADIVARWTVIAVLYSAAVWIGREATGDIEVLRTQYIDPALVLGVVLGLTAWSILVDYRVAGLFTTELSPNRFRLFVQVAAPITMFAAVFALTLSVPRL